MTNHNIDNGASSNFGKVILWQYDLAYNLIGFLTILDNFFAKSTKDFWDYIGSSVANVDSLDDFGLAVWGMLLGVERPVVTYGGASRRISAQLYAKLLKAKFALYKSRMSLRDIRKYVYSVFGSQVTLTDTLDMSIHYAKAFPSGSGYGELEALYDMWPDVVKEYPAGVYDGGHTGDRYFIFYGQQGGSIHCVDGRPGWESSGTETTESYSLQTVDPLAGGLRDESVGESTAWDNTRF